MGLAQRMLGGAAQMRGGTTMRVVARRVDHYSPGNAEALVQAYGLPLDSLPAEVNAWRKQNYRAHLLPGLKRLRLAKRLGVPYFFGALYLTLYRAGDPTPLWFGLASLRSITTAGVNFLVDAWQNTTEMENFKFHGLGTGVTAESVADTALVTELTTQYTPDNTRATGSLTEGGTANVFRTVGANTVDAAAAVTEHGILSQAAVGGGVLWDRSVFSVINLANGDTLSSQYDMTASSGG